MKVKTVELTGAALDWAVAKACGHETTLATATKMVVIRRNNVTDYFSPSTCWGWAGPIIEREDLFPTRYCGAAEKRGKVYQATKTTCMRKAPRTSSQPCAATSPANLVTKLKSRMS